MSMSVIFRMFRLIVVILLTGYFSFSQSVKNGEDSQLKRLGMSGKIKSLVSKTFSAIDNSGKICKGKRLYTQEDDSVFFNSNGSIINCHYLDFKGNLASSCFFEYDSMFYRTDEKVYDGKGKLVNHTQIKNSYDQDGNVIEIASVLSGDAIINKSQTKKTTYKYDKNGNRVEMIFFDTRGIANYKHFLKYNQNRKLIEESCFSSNGKSLYRDLYDYDINGNRALWDHFYSNGTLVSKVIQKYDQDNNLTDNQFYEYSKDGKLTSESVLKYKYDLKRNKTEETSYNSKGEVEIRRSYCYKYDNQKNWIERTEFINGKPTKIAERKIDYLQ